MDDDKMDPGHEKGVGKRWSAVGRKKFRRGNSSFKQLGS